MGFHHVYDNANIKETICMINELEEHLQSLINDACEKRKNNKNRQKRRKIQEMKKKLGEETSSVSSDEEISYTEYEYLTPRQNSNIINNTNFVKELFKILTF